MSVLFQSSHTILGAANTSHLGRPPQQCCAKTHAKHLQQRQAQGKHSLKISCDDRRGHGGHAVNLMKPMYPLLRKMHVDGRLVTIPGLRKYPQTQAEKFQCPCRHRSGIPEVCQDQRRALGVPSLFCTNCEHWRHAPGMRGSRKYSGLGGNLEGSGAIGEGASRAQEQCPTAEHCTCKLEPQLCHVSGHKPTLRELRGSHFNSH